MRHVPIHARGMQSPTLLLATCALTLPINPARQFYQTWTDSTAYDTVQRNTAAWRNGTRQCSLQCTDWGRNVACCDGGRAAQGGLWGCARWASGRKAQGAWFSAQLWCTCRWQCRCQVAVAHKAADAALPLLLHPPPSLQRFSCRR